MRVTLVVALRSIQDHRDDSALDGDGVHDGNDTDGTFFFSFLLVCHAACFSPFVQI